MIEKTLSTILCYEFPKRFALLDLEEVLVVISIALIIEPKVTRAILT
jgi:hypothetical protein